MGCEDMLKNSIKDLLEMATAKRVVYEPPLFLPGTNQFEDEDISPSLV